MRILQERMNCVMTAFTVLLYKFIIHHHFYNLQACAFLVSKSEEKLCHFVRQEGLAVAT